MKRIYSHIGRRKCSESDWGRKLPSRSVWLLLPGMDCEIIHRRLRALVVEEFKTFDDSELKRHHITVFIFYLLLRRLPC